MTEARVHELEKEIAYLREYCNQLRTSVEHLAHIGVDFGHGCYQPGIDEIEQARELLTKSVTYVE